jgi:hypothetical protein
MMNENPFYYKLINFNNFDEISEKFTNAFKNSTLLNIQASQIESAFLFNNDIPFALADVLKKTIGLNFIEFNPFDKIRPSSKLYENILYLEKFNSFTSAAGIAIRIT